MIYRASLQLFEYAEAKLCFKKVQEIEPDNAAVRTDLSKLKKAMLQYKEAKQAMSKRMVKKIFSEAKSPSATENDDDDGAVSVDAPASSSSGNIHGIDEKNNAACRSPVASVSPYVTPAAVGVLAVVVLCLYYFYLRIYN